MLPRSARLTSPNDFAKTTKSGHRLANSSLVIYLYPTHETFPARCGLIVGKSVGGSVIRHRVSRQIRHLLRAHLEELPNGALVVVRALANSKEITTSEFRDQFLETFSNVLEKSSVQR